MTKPLSRAARGGLSLLALAALALSAAPAGAHEFWIEPDRYQLQSGARLTAEIRNGERFAGTRLFYNPQTFERFDAVIGGRTVPVDGRLGDRPPLDLEIRGDALAVIAYQSTPSLLVYDDFETFERFADHKDLGDVAAAHAARGFSPDRVVETYTRFAKSLVAIGDGAGADAPVGFALEIVALANPYASATETMSVQVFYQGAPRGGAQVELFEKDPDGAVAVTLHRTDAAGVAQLPVRSGRSYLVDTVVLREAPVAGPGRTQAQWESLWASLTFAAPLR